MRTAIHQLQQPASKPASQPSAVSENAVNISAICKPSHTTFHNTAQFQFFNNNDKTIFPLQSDIRKKLLRVCSITTPVPASAMASGRSPQRLLSASITATATSVRRAFTSLTRPHRREAPSWNATYLPVSYTKLNTRTLSNSRMKGSTGARLALYTNSTYSQTFSTTLFASIYRFYPPPFE